MASRVSSTVAKILSYQVLVTMVVSLAFAVGGWHKSFSSLLGGLAAIVPNLYFALRVTSSEGQEARKVLRSFYTGESIKLLLTAVIFALILRIPNIQILPIFAGYVSALSVFWFALLMR